MKDLPHGPFLLKGTKSWNHCIVQVCLATTICKSKWYLDSGCSKHMTEDRSKLTDLKEIDYHEVTFGNSSKGKVIGIGNAENKHITISDVQLVTGLRYNLLSISKLCDSGFKITFSPDNCFIYDQSGKLILVCPRDHNVYTCDLD